MQRKVFNSKRTRRHRLRLRNDPSPVEVILWSRLRRRALEGYKFRRQYSVGGFIVDFYCPAARLAIEVDGAQHFESAETIAHDQERQHAIERYGIRVLRFTGREVLYQTRNVVDCILHCLIISASHHPFDSPPLGGGENSRLDS